MLVRLWFLQVSKLTAQKRFRHEVAASPLKLLRDPCSVRPQKNQPHFVCHTKAIPICPLQGRARDNGIFMCGETTFN